ncbi:MAG: hypothetical protein DM484_08730 [Candidatus Methylumidiphilus alinenensis]|uniref:Restriction endonuclease subunit S n=1 Tax=Candidatus Methylumidiphilus alinenensis TaxID=2202197 RepID=A0A2W4T9E6_9GAMM|nr:MAG: hypothetical protein DM484_08730 [Candidatus Methylumidiphilus alinenensis]
MSRWPIIKLGDVLRLDLIKEVIDPSISYEMVGVLSFGKGLFKRETIDSGNTSYKYFLRLKAEHVVMSQLFGWEGAIALSKPEFNGFFVSPQFPTFLCDESQINRGYLGWVMKQPTFWDDLGSRTKGMGDRRRTLNPEAFFACQIQIPSLDEQHAIVTRLDAVADKVRQVEAKLDEIEADAERLLAIRFREIIEDVKWQTMAEVAPLVRREVEVDLEGSYPELGIRSFGKGTFHKQPLEGADVGSKRLFSIEPGDLLFSNVFAWEGAIAVAKNKDVGRFGSHRFISCLANPEMVSPEFLRYYFLTPIGLEKIGEASPGGAGRNRTLGLEKLMVLQVPTPKLAKQQAFDKLQTKLAEMKAKHTETRQYLKALLPSMLEQIFN